MVLTSRDRKTYIGSTDIASIVGLCKYRNALQIFNQKLGISQPTSNNNAMKWGLKLEDTVLEAAEEELNLKIKSKQVFASHPLYDFLGGTCDAITECGTLLEAKTSRMGSDFTKDSVPDNYMIQVQWLLGLNNLKKAYLCVLIGGQEFRTYPIYFDQSLFDKMVRICISFWNNNILTMTPPAIQETINIELPTDVYILYKNIREIQETISNQTAKLEELKNQFSTLTEGLSEIRNNGELIAKKTSSVRETLDRKELEKVMDLTPFLKKTEYTTTRFY